MTRRDRRTIRLRDYDYAQNGAYFVTVCAHEQECLFGTVYDGMVVPNSRGKSVKDCWQAIPAHFPFVELDEFVVMPNHMHGIIVITSGADNIVGAQHAAPLHLPPSPKPGGITPNNVTRGSLGAIVRAFKSAVTNAVNQTHTETTSPVWQRNYYEHIIRNEADLDRVRAYILNNPSRWTEDELYMPRAQQ
jgi:REP element-mobilizing transposase RayT